MARSDLRLPDELHLGMEFGTDFGLELGPDLGPELVTRPGPAEEADCFALAVKGEIPLDLDGTLLRIGPDGSADPDGGVDGQPFVGALRIRHGHAEWYRARRVRTDEVCRRTGELPSPGPRRCATDHTAAAVIRHGRRTLALGDGALPYELTPELRTKARHDFDGTLPFGFSARPIHDPLTGELFAAAAGPRTLRYLAVDVQGRVRKSETIPVPEDPARYAFALTERHAVFLGPTSVGVMPREGGPADVTWIDTAPTLEPAAARPRPAVLPVNAFEHRDGGIAIDLLLTNGTPGLWRRHLDPAAGTAHDELLDAHTQDLPTIDDRYHGSSHRHVFSRLLTTDGLLPTQERTSTALLHHDLATGETRVHDAAPDRLLGAPVFVPDGPTAPEGHGWILAFAHATTRGHDEVVILDTADLTGPPVAVIELPGTAPREASASWVVQSPWF